MVDKKFTPFGFIFAVFSQFRSLMHTYPDWTEWHKAIFINIFPCHIATHHVIYMLSEYSNK